MTREEAYKRFCSYPTDICDYLPLLYNLTVLLNAKLVIELGMRDGNSSSAFLYGIEKTGGRLWSCDLDPLHETCIWRKHEPSDLINFMHDQDWTRNRGDDIELAPTAPTGADILFIDTSHLYEHTAAELKSYFPKLNDNGILIIHDTDGCYPGQDQAVNEFLELHKVFHRHSFPRNGVVGGIEIFYKYNTASHAIESFLNNFLK